MLFADDTALFSESATGLQCLLDGLQTYCNRWGITVNKSKTKVVIFQGGNRNTNVQLYYANDPIETVKHFTYLGITLTSNGKFYLAQKHLSDQATKALFSLNSLFDKIKLSVPDKMYLFDAMVSPILNYGCEIWGFHRAPDIEKVHLRFLKQLLCVRSQTCTLAVYGECGRVPFSIIRKERILKYWRRVLSTDNTLLTHVFAAEVNNINNTTSWAYTVKSMLDGLGFTYLWNRNDVTKPQLKMVIQRLYDHYLQSWYSDVRNSSKLSTYQTFKTSFAAEKYLSAIENDSHRIELTRFRCSAHKT